MNCGALRTVNDDAQLQSTAASQQQRSKQRLQQQQQQEQQQLEAQRKMHSMPRTPTAQSQLQSTSTAQCRVVAMEQPLRRSTMPRGRGLASCLRGERDDAPTPPVHEVHCELQQFQLQQQQQLQQQLLQQQQQQQQQQDQLQLGSGIQTPAAATAAALDAAGRSEYKSKTLPRIHFDTALNDTSLNEALA
ncbi:hypothetical protein AWZ03_010249 [Drosophila navojoa]|uniref:Uncharacterized protein n=1 Tax=Drosophila navojoa TaxID=7232 RepID=A0A484B5J1_DRONA|nr:hypothetical protein AWZ03_010249 [Drosophila navojoa]